MVSAIGAGGMGEVYRAKDTKLDREVAIKVLPASFALDGERVARFTREAKTLAALNHPNIAGIYGIEESHGAPALIMELVDGEDLSTLIAGGQRHPEAESGNSGGASRPLWAFDDRHIYFTSVAGTNVVLSVLALGATAPTAFEQPGPFVHFEDVTRDGRYLVFKSVKARSEVWIQRVGGAERRALVQTQFRALQPRVSPDGHWLAYALDLPSGFEVFAQPFERPGDRIQVSVKNGIAPVWRDDSRELYYEGPDGLMAVPMTERDGALTAGTPQRLFAIRTQGTVTNQPHNVEVAAHGQKFLVNTIVGDSDNAPLEVTLNWTTGLTK